MEKKMAKDYIVKKIKVPGAASGWVIFETKTSQAIKLFSDSLQAKTVNTHLNGGGGFAGDTPPFFLKDNYRKHA